MPAADPRTIHGSLTRISLRDSTLLRHRIQQNPNCYSLHSSHPELLRQRSCPADSTTVLQDDGLICTTGMDGWEPRDGSLGSDPSWYLIKVRTGDLTLLDLGFLLCKMGHGF